MEKCEVYDILISFIKSCKNSKEGNGHPSIRGEYKGKKTWIWNADYLFNQILRQIDVPPERYLVSEAAQELWDKITDEPISKYYYREKVVATREGAEIYEFKGSSKKSEASRILKIGDSFIFNDVFHLEHTIPIKIIIDELTSLNDEKLDYEHVDDILSKMYICRILKSEDRNINQKYNRSSVLEEVLVDVYEPAGIIIAEKI